MKYFILISLVSLSSFASVDKVQKLRWDGENYHVTLNQFQREIVISGKNQNIPCLENAYKSEMQILIDIDSDIPMIKSCKLYSPGLVGNKMQTQQERSETTSPVKKK